MKGSPHCGEPFIVMVVMISVNLVKPKVRPQALGHHNAVRRLVVLKKGGYDARQRQG